MRLNRLALDQFRTYGQLVIEPPSQGLRITGRNASGKTSILEALVLLSTTRSPRTGNDRDVVRWRSGEEFGVRPYSRIEASIETRDGPRRVGVNLELDADRLTLARKQFRLNGEPVRAQELVGVLKCVLFSPEDVLLVSGPPSERRRQLDILISQMDRAYLYALSQYGKVLVQRNQLLKRFARERRSIRDRAAVNEISFWDEELVTAGSTVMARRQRVVARIGELVRVRSHDLVADAALGVSYVPRLPLPDGPAGDDDDRPRIAAAYQSAIEEVRHEEFRRGVTVVGPHRDNVAFQIDDRDLASFGSRGQQRLGVVAYRLAEIDIIDEVAGERPILLLDDVLSELDSVHRELLLAAVAGCDCQVIVTSTDAASLDHPVLRNLPAGRIEAGNVEFDE